MSVCLCERERERDRERDRERQRQTDRQTDRQTETEIETGSNQIICLLDFFIFKTTAFIYLYIYFYFSTGTLGQSIQANAGTLLVIAGQ